MGSTQFIRIASINEEGKVERKYLLKIDGKIVERTEIIEDTILKSISLQVEEGIENGTISISGGAVSLNVANLTEQLEHGKYAYALPTEAVASTINVWFNGVNVIDEVTTSSTQIEFKPLSYPPEAFASGGLVASYIEK